MAGSRPSWFWSTFRLPPTLKKLLRVLGSSRETSTWYLPVGPTSGQTIHGRLESPATSEPDAIAASAASLSGFTLRAQAVSSGVQGGTLIHLKPPGALASATPRAVNTRPGRSAPTSCQVIHG